jgi:hypothetical protein
MTTEMKLLLALISAILLTGSFSLGRSYQKNSQEFTYHQINVVGGGVALIVPSKWNVVSVWDKHGRPYMRPTDEEG